MKPRLTLEVVPVRDPDAESSLDAALDLLADALTESILADSRAELAATNSLPLAPARVPAGTAWDGRRRRPQTGPASVQR